jgi:4-hydroxy-4-methyl-2-oxoglutarate aldolase
MNKEMVQEVCERYKKLYTGAICDNLDKRGLRDQILPYYIQSMTGNVKIAGPAFTGQGMPVSDIKNTDMVKRLDMLNSITPLSISVWATGGDVQSAHWGEIMSTAARERGCQGAVVEGGVRDMDFILEMGFPVFARYKCPASSVGRWEIKEWQIPVKIGSTTINPGDFIFGDIDGVVVIPQAIALDVLKEAEDLAHREDGMRKELKEGMLVTDAYKKYGAL